MKITDILTESQHQELMEGPLLNKVGSAVGKTAGTVAKGVGAVAGGVAGLARASKKGYQAGKAMVGAGGDEEPQATPSTATTAQAINAQGPQGTAPAQSQTGTAAAALNKTAQAMAGANAAKAGQTLYAQVKANIEKLDKKGKQRILALLQKSLAQPAQQPTSPAAKAAPAAQPATSQASQPATAAPAQAAPQPMPAAAPASAKPAMPKAKAAAAPAEQPPAAAGKKPAAKKSKPKLSQAEIDAERERIMGPTSDSIIRTGNVVAESRKFSLFRQQ